MDAVILVHQLVDWQLQVDADIDILLTACSMSCNTYQLQNQMKGRRYNHNMSCICNCVLCMVIRALVQFVCKYCSSHQLMMMHVVYMVMVIGDVYSVHVCTPVHHLAESNCNLMYYRVYCPSQFHIVTFSSDPSHFPETLQLLVHRLMLTATRATIFNTDCNICINAHCASTFIAIISASNCSMLIVDQLLQGLQEMQWIAVKFAMV